MSSALKPAGLIWPTYPTDNGGSIPVAGSDQSAAIGTPSAPTQDFLGQLSNAANLTTPSYIGYPPGVIPPATNALSYIGDPAAPTSPSVSAPNYMGGATTPDSTSWLHYLFGMNNGSVDGAGFNWLQALQGFQGAQGAQGSAQPWMPPAGAAQQGVAGPTQTNQVAGSNYLGMA